MSDRDAYPDGLLVEQEDGVLTVTFDRAEVGNAIPRTFTQPLTDLFVSVNADAAIRCVLIRGNGAHFSLGGDVKGFAADLEKPAAERQADFRTRLDAVSALVAAWDSIDVPIVAACQGGVAGAGLMYPLGADVVLAEPGSFLIFAHQRLALTPDGGVSSLLPRVVGERMARQLVLTSARVEAEEASRLNIFSRIVATGDLDAEAGKAARRFAQGSGSAARRAKALMRGALGRPIAQQLDAERDAIVESVGHADFAEGVRAFVEKRPPNFSKQED